MSANELIQTFGSNILFAYDVGCMFSVTLSKSSIGDLAHQANFKSCMGSFHGAAHKQTCQLNYLISMKEGAGLEDCHTCDSSPSTHLHQTHIRANYVIWV